MRRLAFVTTLIVTACSEPQRRHLDVPAGCNPLSMDACVLPIPSSVWERADRATVTKVRLNLPEETLPAVTSRGERIPLDPTPYNELDGWSPATSVFLTFKEPVNPVNLVRYDNLAASLTPTSSTVILDAETGERVVHWAELDMNDAPPTQRGPTPYLGRGLLIRPAGLLKSSHHYIIAITTDLKPASGGTFTPPPAFTALRDDELTDHPVVERLRPRYEGIFATLAKAGVPKNKLLLAWDFTTGSDDANFRDLLAMRAQALAALGESGIAYTITKTTESKDPSAPILLKIEGTFTSPLFLEDKGALTRITCVPKVKGDCPIPGLNRGPDGLPKQYGVWERPFLLLIPRAAILDTLPVVQFGHGLLGGTAEMLSGYNQRVSQELRFAQVGSPLTGMNAMDIEAVAAALVNFNRFPAIVRRVQQGLVDWLALARTLKKIAADPAVQVNGRPAFDPQQVHYYGISQGGIFGGAYMGFTPDIEKGVLNVGAGAWSLMMNRSTNWKTYGRIMHTGYASYLDKQIVIVLSQNMWDLVDPIRFAPHLLANPLSATPAKKILYQVAVNDSQVPYQASEKMARAMGIKLIVPSAKHVYGLVTTNENTSGYTVWDEHPEPPVYEENIPPESDNGTHGSIRDLPELKAQIRRFLFEDGMVVNTCNGKPCSYVNGELQ